MVKIVDIPGEANFNSLQGATLTYLRLNIVPSTKLKATCRFQRIRNQKQFRFFFQ